MIGSILFLLLAALFVGGSTVVRTPAPAAPRPEEPPAAKTDKTADDKTTDDKTDKTDKVVVDEKSKTVRVPAVVARQGQYEVLKGAIEYVLVSRGGKAYEALFLTDTKPADLHAALAKIGLKSGKPASADAGPSGARVKIVAEFERAGKKERRPIDEFVLRSATGKPLEAGDWTFTGSTKAYDPGADREVLACTVSKNLVGLHYNDSSTLVQNPRKEARQENIYKSNLKLLPKEGTRVTIVFARVLRAVPAGSRRVHVFVSGRVQGVGFRAFTQREARKLKLTGFVVNLADGRVEAVIEGPGEAVGKILEKMARGPRAARVKELKVKEEAPEGSFQNFEVRYEKP